MTQYIHDEPDWPTFRWDQGVVTPLLAQTAHAQGKLLGRMELLGFDPRQEAMLRTLTEDVLKTSAIEGEVLEPREVRSSLARQLGLDAAGLPASSRHVDGIVEMTLDATGNLDLPLTEARLHAWHAALFPGGYSGLKRIATAAWRTDSTGPMQVVSGPVGRERVHFEAVPAARIPLEISRFLEAFNRPLQQPPILASALAHLWFVTIHPYEDGNGRIARAIADMALARSDGSGQRFYSMSAQIMAERAAYYAVLEQTQKGSLDITGWMVWYCQCLARAIANADKTLGRVLHKAVFWQRAPVAGLNARQTRVLNALLDGFEGKLTTSRYAALAKCSQDTALRDLAELAESGLLVKGTSRGRSTHYTLASPPPEEHA